MKYKIFGTTALAAILFLSTVLPAYAQGNGVLNGSSEFELTASRATKVARVTGATQPGESVPNPNQTIDNYALTATDLGIMWDATTDPTDKKIMVAFGDSYDNGWGGFGGGGNSAGWRSNLLAISKDTLLSDGLTFSSMIMDENKAEYSKEIISSAHNTSGSGDFTAIPTAGITVGTRHYIHYMQIKNWGANGRWNTNFSEIAYSDDEGQNWTKSGVKWGAASKFAQAAYVKDGGYVYMFGTPAGRFDKAYLARTGEADLLNKEKYEYWSGTSWIVNDEAAAKAIVDAPVSELSVAYNSYYEKWIMTYLNENRYAIVMRSSSSLTGGWSAETEVVTGAEFPGLYGGFIHPWTNNGKDLYMVVSEWGPYNSILMHSTLNVGTPLSNLIADPSFELQASGTIAAPWTLEAGTGGIDRNFLSRAGSNNLWLRNASGWNAITQKVQVVPVTEYKLTAFIRTSPNFNDGYFGVRDSHGTIVKETKLTKSDNYTPVEVLFNSGSSTELTLFTGMHAAGDTWMQADDYMLLPIIVEIGIESIKEVDVSTTAGSAPVLPSKVEATYSDGTVADVSVVWDAVEEFSYAQAGSFTVNGTVADTAVKASAKILVTAAPVSSGPVPAPILSSERSITAEELKTMKDGDAPFKLNEGQKEFHVPIQAADILKDRKLIVTAGEVKLHVPAAVLAALKDLLPEQSLQDARIVLRATPVDQALFESNSNDGKYKQDGIAYELDIAARTADGKETRLDLLPQSVHVSLPYQASETDEALLGVYRFNEVTALWEYAGGQIDKPQKRIAADISHFSKYAILSYDKEFTDVGTDHWAYQILKTLSAKHIVEGVDANRFEPKANMTRAEFAALLVRALNIKTTSNTLPFTDVRKGAWYLEEVAAAYEAGLITGITEASFAPNAAITREQMAVMVIRANAYSNDADQQLQLDASAFTDADKVSAWAREAVEQAAALGLMKGKGADQFDPQANALRIETAQVIFNLLDTNK